MTGIPSIQAFAELVGGRMINCLMAGVLVTLSASILLWVFARRNSSARYAVWFSTLLGIAALSLAACFGSRQSNLQPVSGVTLPGSWAMAAFGLWVVGAGIGLLRIAMGLWRIWRIRRCCVELHPFAIPPAAGSAEVDPVLRRTLEEFGSKRGVSLCLSGHIKVPATIGFFRPAVVIPAWAMKELSGTQLRAILLHELGHLRRRDDWTNLAQKVLRALLFFHPAVWWIDSRLALEREIACDDFVLAQTADARGYAECLVCVAEKSAVQRGLALAVAAVSRMRQTATRLSRILNPDRSTEFRVSRPALATIAMVCLVALAELPRIPTIVAFQDAPSAQLAPKVSRAANANVELEPQIVEAMVREDLARTEGAPKSNVRTADFESQVSPSSATVRSRRKLQLIRASRQRRTSALPVLVGTACNMGQASAPTFLVVVETASYTLSGSSAVSIRVWQVSVIEQQKQAELQNRTGLKSI